VWPLRAGERTLLAASCNGCGQLRPGTDFPRRVRGRSKRPYLDLRCRRCQFARMEDIKRLQSQAGLR
jgi:hypothetical protein